MPALTVLSAFLVRARAAAERGTPRLVAELFCFDKAAVATSGARRPTYGVIVFAGGAIDPLEGGAVMCPLSESGGTGAPSLFLAIVPEDRGGRRDGCAGSTAAPAES